MRDCQETIHEIMNESFIREFSTKYKYLVSYISITNEFDALQKAKNDNVIELFYVWLVRRIAIRRRVYFLSDDADFNSTENLSITVLIINELSGHLELLDNGQIKEWIEQMRYLFFSKLQSIPEELDISLESLLLTNVNGKCVAAYIRDHKYCRSDIGTYLLIKNEDLYTVQHNNRDIIKLICRAFIEKNGDLETYVQMINEKCELYGVKLDYIQVEQIKEYLQRAIVYFHKKIR